MSGDAWYREKIKTRNREIHCSLVAVREVSDIFQQHGEKRVVC
jgi:hypothetical protein